VPDSLYEETRLHFSSREITDLTWAIVAINGWNRIAISFRSVPGEYEPELVKEPARQELAAAAR
jgi:hypothetical protein